MTHIRNLILAAVLLLLVGGAVYPLIAKREADREAAAQRPPALPVVQVASAESRPLTRTVRLTGNLQSGSEAALSPKQGGKVAAVYVREGDPVKRGQVLVRLDPGDLQGQVDTAAAGVRAARAQLDKAISGERLKRIDVERRVREARLGLEQARRQVEKAQAGIDLQRKANEAQIHRAEAGVEAAKADLARAQRGARPQQKEQAEIGVRQAQRGVDLAKKNLDDVQFLYEKGGLPRVQLDQAKEGYQKALDGLQQAKSQLSLLEAGATPEDIEAARQQVRIAEAGLEAAKSAANREAIDKADLEAAQGQVRMAEDGLRTAEASRAELETIRQDIRSARAAYEQALSGHRLAVRQLEGLEIVSPVDGIATSVSTNPGEIAGPGRPLVTVVGTSGVYLQAGVPARTLPQLSPGMAVTVTVDSVPGRRFPGAIRSIGATADQDGRTFPVRIDVHAPAGLLKPGALARAEVQSGGEQLQVTVPSEAVQVEGDQSSVWVVRNGAAEKVPVQVPLQEGGLSFISGAVQPGDQVAVSGAAALTPGSRVEVRR